MFYVLKLLLVSINIDSEMILNWFGLEDFIERKNLEILENNPNLTVLDLDSSTKISLNTFQLILEGFWEQIKDGLALSDIENILFFLVFFRFIIIAYRYNLKTSFYITGAGLFAGYLWYKHLIDLIFAYRMILIKLPFLNKLGIDAVKLSYSKQQLVLNDLNLKDNTHWSNPGQIIYYAIVKGITHTDLETGLRYYIDPISMIISNLKEPNKSVMSDYYYTVYNTIIPKLSSMISKFWFSLAPIVSYTFVTRIGKRYCPYLIRWHWTFLVLLGLFEQFISGFVHRIYYFQSFVLIPQTESFSNSIDSSLMLQLNILNGVIGIIAIAHILFIIFGLLHAVTGQYFYFPFLVDTTELHIGWRTENDFYTDGFKAWQSREELDKRTGRTFPKLWYGWFGRQSENTDYLGNFIRAIMKVWRKNLRNLKKAFRRLLR